MSLILYHNDEQKDLALKTKEQEQEHRKKKIHTEIKSAKEFYLAEDYHQKYMLQRRWFLLKEFQNIPFAEFVNSPVATKLNGYMGGYGSLEQLQREMDSFDLSKEVKEELLALFDK